MWGQFFQKGYFRSKAEKINIIIEIHIFEEVQIPNFTLNKQILIHGPKSEHHHQIQRTRIILAAKFQLKIGLKYFQSKTENIKITIEFRIFDLDSVLIFQLLQAISILGPNLSKNGISRLKQEKGTSPSNSAYSKQFKQ